MATTYATICGFLDEMGLKYEMNEERHRIYTGFPTKSYADEDGDKLVFIAILLEEDGEYLKDYAPSVYACKDGPNKLAVLQTCLMVSWKTKMLQYEYDEGDGEIRAIIEFPLEDAELTQKQLRRGLFGVVHLVDHYHPAFQAALESGKVDFSGLGDQDQLAQLFGSLADLGPDGLREVVEEVARRRAAGAGTESEPPEEL